jgi:hypothetical protein
LLEGDDVFTLRILISKNGKKYTDLILNLRKALITPQWSPMEKSGLSHEGYCTLKLTGMTGLPPP